MCFVEILKTFMIVTFSEKKYKIKLEYGLVAHVHI